MVQPSEEAKSQFKFPQLHSNSLERVAMVAVFAAKFREIGIPDFGWLDLTLPMAKRTNRVLSAVVNFARFRAEKLELLRTHRDEQRAAQDRLDEVKKENLQLYNQLKALTERQESEAAEVAEVQAEVA